MTSKVTVDAHAGWPVEVTQTEAGAEPVVTIVEPGQVQDFYVHNGHEIHVRELVRGEEV